MSDSDWKVGDHRVTRRSREVYVGGPNPWRECDADGWIAHDGNGAPDFGGCERIDIKERGGCARDAVLACNEVECASTLWDFSREFYADRTHWRPATPSPSQGMTPEAVRGVLRGEKAEAEPALTRENAKFALVSDDLGIVRQHCVPEPETIVGRVVAIRMARDKHGLIQLASEQWLNDGQWTPHPGPASAPKAEEPAKEEDDDGASNVAPLGEWIQALGMLSPYAPLMVVDTLDPVGMARQIMAAIEAQLPPEAPKPSTPRGLLLVAEQSGKLGGWGVTE